MRLSHNFKTHKYTKEMVFFKLIYPFKSNPGENLLTGHLQTAWQGRRGCSQDTFHPHLCRHLLKSASARDLFKQDQAKTRPLQFSIFSHYPSSSFYSGESSLFLVQLYLDLTRLVASEMNSEGVQFQ